MAYNPLSAVQAIANYKNIYANAADDNERNDAATKAKQYYDELMANGQGDIANKLKSSDYAGAAKIQDGLGTNGMVQTRDYVKNKLKAYGGISDSDFGYNPENQNVTLKGVNLGKAGYESSDGRTYYNQGDLYKQIQNVIQTNNMGRTDKVAYDTTKEDLIARQKTKMDEINGDPTQSAIYKSIMESVVTKSVAAGENAVATGAADNGGNIDSFAAANGLRQKTAVQNMGRETALNSWLAQQNLARGLLQDYSGTTQNLFNNGQTENLNTAKINESIAGITGTVPNDVSIKSNPFFNPDGTLIDPNTDFQAIINNAPNEATKQYAIQARAKKLLLPQYSQYGTPEFAAPAKTATVTMSEKELAAKENIAANELSSKEKLGVLDANTKMYVADGKPAKVTDDDKYNVVIQDMTTNPQGSSVYFPLQQARDNYNDYVGLIGETKLKGVILNEAEKVAAAEVKAGGKVTAADVLKRYGFERYAKADAIDLSKLVPAAKQ